ncbi:MAG TPA: enoyl-CoA hydratase-related protein [Syntrophales bacterium]|nr:enoyl-CoA hydratase-related protein [Syntrophales bacterium]
MVLVQQEGQIATITINQPEKLNILTRELITHLTEAFRTIEKEKEVRVIVLTAAGDRAFVGGVDVHVFADLDATGAKDFITDLHRCCLAIRESDKIVIAAINGHALGGGLEIVASCDLRVASENAGFGMPEVKVGLPSVIEAAYLPRLIGLGRAAELIYIGDTIGAQEAQRIGLVNRVVPHDQLQQATLDLARKILENGPTAMKLQKKLVRQWMNLPLDDSIEAGITAFRDCFETAEPCEGAMAFLKKRKPSWE